ncbi:MAG TPA: S-methyl-5'-thioadenosine phosphorylase [Dehalococcoidia bacterium]|nr:S-methyl-5'-thioadenosine phosphorylase [Dehalococcoidia bacterium]
MSGHPKLAIIGGSGFYRMDGLEDITEVRVSTPFGDPSDAIVIGTLEGVRTAFLPRHGVGHRILPGEVPAQANIWALKSLGVERIVSVSAAGSLRTDIEPLHMVVPDQLIDRTRNRRSTFFGNGLVAHIAFDEPFCPQLREALAAAAEAAGAVVHRGGTFVVMEGPAFSTKAESLLYRSWNADLIGMTALPEAKLAREAEICYATLACITDYDTWHEGHARVSADLILANLRANVEASKRVVREVARRFPEARACACGDALATAIVTSLDIVPEETKRALGPIIGKYIAERPAEAGHG